MTTPQDMNRDEHRRFEDDLAAFMLGALAGEDKVAFEVHLKGCARCQADERWLRAAADLLPSSVEQIEPPPELRKRLMDTVRVEAQPGRERRQAGWLRERFSSLLRPMVAAGAAAVLAIGVGAGYLLAGDDGGGASTVSAQATKPGAGARLIRGDDATVVRVWGLPRERGRVYEVWLERGGKVERSSLFTVWPDGTGSAGVPGKLEGVDRLMVSSEPEGGSAQPTRAPVLVANL